MASVAGSCVLRKVCFSTQEEMTELRLECRGCCVTSLLHTWTRGQKVKEKMEKLNGKLGLIFHFWCFMGSFMNISNDNQFSMTTEAKSSYFWILETIDKANGYNKCSYSPVPFQRVISKNPVKIKWPWNFAPNALMTSAMAGLPAPCKISGLMAYYSLLSWNNHCYFLCWRAVNSIF